MKKFFLLLAIALVVPVSTSCSEDNNRKKNALFAGVLVLVGGALVYKYWWNKSPETSTPSADNPTPNANNTNPQQNNPEQITPPVPAIPLNKVIPVPDVPDEDHKAIENTFNASKKPIDTDAKPTPIICPPTKTEQPKAILAEKTPQSVRSSYGEILCDALKRFNHRSSTANVDQPNNDLFDIIMGH